ncbi:MAG TPA: hypothetical protein VFR62_02255 [Gemmatimonadales bacterium]|nr:hypothetical protein [Gemmatimonadales bacterium]
MRWPGRTLAFPLVAGAVAGLLCWIAYRIPPASTSDFEPLWVAARALRAGQDPYDVVPTMGTRYPLYYPLPAVLLSWPLGLLSFSWARVLWAALGAAVFVLAALRYQRGLLPALLSASFLNAVIQGQWSPLLTAAAVLPALSWIWAAKPSVGAALFAAYPNRRAVLGGLVLVGLTLAVFPVWPMRWLEALRETNHVAPIARPGGVLLLLAILRWRLPEGRLLAGMACVPQTIGLYEALPLFLIPRSRWQGYLLAGLSYVAAFAQVLVVPRQPGVSWEATNAERWPFAFCFLYLPALGILFFSTRKYAAQPRQVTAPDLPTDAARQGT